jgi:hypothetical protein
MFGVNTTIIVQLNKKTKIIMPKLLDKKKEVFLCNLVSSDHFPILVETASTGSFTSNHILYNLVA